MTGNDSKVSRRKYVGYAAAGIVVVAGAAAGAYYQTRPGPTATTTEITETGETSPTTMSLEEIRRKYAGTTIRAVMSAGYQTEPVLKLKNEFEEKTGIKVEIEVYDEPTARDKMILDFQAHSATYDLDMVQFWYFDEYHRAGWIEPIDDYVATKKDPWLDLAQIPEGAIKAFTRGGKLYGLPFTLLGGMLYYRTDVYKKHGLSVPKTIDELIEQCKKIKPLETNIYPFAGRGSTSFDSFGSSIGWAWAYGAKVLDENNKPICTSPEMTKAMEDYVMLLKDYGAPGQASMSWPEISELWIEGKIVNEYETSDMGTFFENPEQSKTVGITGYAPMPVGPAGNAVQWTYTDAFCLNKDSKNKDAAWLFMQWRVSEDMYIREVEENLRLDMPFKKIYTLPLYEAKSQELKLGEYTKSLPECQAVAVTEYWPLVPEFTKIAEGFQVPMSLAVSGDISVGKALEEAQNNVDQIMRTAGYY